MPRNIESGKTRFILGSIVYLWEEIKTMNSAKIRALSKMASGYLKMKRDRKRPNLDHT